MLSVDEGKDLISQLERLVALRCSLHGKQRFPCD